MNTILSAIESAPIIPVYYQDDIDNCIQILQRCYDGGIRVFEFVNRGSEATRNFQLLKKYRDENLKDLKLGIGTIKSKQEALDFLNLGAEFIVSPIVKPEIAEVTLKNNILWIPGCMTPTEISVAEELGAPLVKLFPGDALGPNYLKAIQPLFPSLKFMPTGGVLLDEKNLTDWFNAGVSAVGMGSKLFSNPTESETTSYIEDRLIKAFQHIKTIK
ncbi:bifunctional 4-hydroxy-2-oxoglutarate aldolase/2-dehydro-3-deoxy-phosphogluconate aldolase [Sphingobacterium sp. SRCM116780]|uniref:bifunctional 4-hydroxy-2-oxoglutarate aldolase/2-dehydro-3-deoxy-phosphogluconate aldolase n=1 Tax=Sphingobacterium sp. SRCM116780 TaxID=2907623 RepID=UPI001F1EBDFF|nr:bifunctional 4-hydroxy-2-oxoglutarate aldolase/2-dehydro-3-deoxy-phosphogluconate aldolase [Sphingobacterium sp. SRCM116780]UIR56398.1 bifunctional 4-hydroxy-2-oxoglutarate aldolase/2-dehydro-3-deoxy-phosphogluconate aldolase [Sphingobacterium sp. SRCM116780]